MKIPFVDLLAQYKSIQKKIDLAVHNVIQETAFVKGKYVEEFEERYAEEYGVKHCMGIANGTDAIYIALKMLGIKKGDEVITTSLSWISTTESNTLTGAKPVFVDIEEDYFTIDPSKIEEKINENTKAIIPVHLYGQCADMDPILDIANKYNLFVIEDTAQAHFAEYKGNKAGTMGDVGTFSFYPGKNLGAYGDAGAIITNNDDLAYKMRMYANHGALVKHQHLMEGINSRLDGLQAAILSVKLNFIHKWNSLRREKAAYYNDHLKNVPGVTIPKKRINSKHVYHVYCIKAEHRDALMIGLKSADINTAIHYPIALPNMSVYGYLRSKKGEFPTVSMIQKRILSLPMFPEITNEQIDYVVSSIRKFV